MSKDIILKTFKRYTQAIIGIFIIAVAFNLFILPNDFVYGGFVGLSIIIQQWVDISPSVFIFISSVFLLLLSYITLDKEKTIASILGSLFFPLAVELTSGIADVLEISNYQPLLHAIFGGVLTGVGFGLTYKAGFTTGGTDILAQIVAKYIKISMGKAVAICDGIILIGGGFVFGINNCMYAIIILYLISLLTDKVLLGISDTKAFYVFTEKDVEVKEYVLNKMKHGVTTFDAKGGYKNNKQKVLFCVVPTKEYIKLKEEITQIDKEAFFIVTDAYEVYGGE